MKIAKLLIEGAERYAVIKDGRYYLAEGDCFALGKIDEKAIDSPFKILPPVNPSKIVALGANYRKHAAELSLKINAEPCIFLKPPTSIIADGEDIVLPPSATKVDYEAELTIIIKKDCKNVPKDKAKSVILGYTCANDVSERVFQKLDGQWARAKGFDTFCPLGPCIETELDGDNANLMTVRNGEVVQKGNTADMINGVAAIVSFVSSVMTLKKGDIILTGTPENIGQIRAGDTVEIVIEGIGRLVNKVIQG
ncbi:MAG: fumarylacetoacetate hydrolase family protein [Clostridia bacterium]|nr:fumarylacetoacetate hydrolase family protein [Clostridia bacterium]